MARGMLDIRDHDRWRVEIELLYRAIGADREEACARSIKCHAADMFQGGNRVKRDVLCPHIPRQGFAILISKMARVGKFQSIPIRELDDTAVLGPPHPIGTVLDCFCLAQNSDNLSRVFNIINFSDAPNSQVTIVLLHGKHF